ncbi:MAG: S49 family peptidase [Firmicutes bacterium]|nr:S49 family peptidase [Bacillota bacterium]
MPGWNEVYSQIQAAGTTYDIIRRQYLGRLQEITGRNVIAYYSGWLQKQPLLASFHDSTIVFAIDDNDKNGFMATIHGLDREAGLDLILHTPGGSIGAAQSLVHYLRQMFGTNIRAIVPQLAMSAGTMIACACREIVMGKHSSLGPIDPQVHGFPAHGVLEEFENARERIAKNPGVEVPLWQPIIAKYTPTLVGECQKAIEWTKEIVQDWLRTGMFATLPAEAAKQRAAKVVEWLGDHALTKSHDRHVAMDDARNLGLTIVALEDSPELQDAVLSVHHAFMQTLDQTLALKIVENHKGVAVVQSLRPQLVPFVIPSASVIPPVTSPPSAGSSQDIA